MDAKQVASGLAADVALGAIITRLPGGLFASLVIGLESDNPQLMEAQRLEERVDELTKYIPNYDAMTEEEKQASRAVLKEIIKAPLKDPEPPPPKAPMLPFFDEKKWLPPRTDWA
jgi:AAA+ ATPase superfamily predicted ATPase